MKKISKVLLVALIGFGIIAVVPAVKAGDAENCWGGCDNDAAQNMSRAAEDTVDFEACWGRCDTDASQDPDLYPEFFTWHDPADKNDGRGTTASFSWDDPAGDERETMASYR